MSGRQPPNAPLDAGRRAAPLRATAASARHAVRQTGTPRIRAALRPGELDSRRRAKAVARCPRDYRQRERPSRMELDREGWRCSLCLEAIATLRRLGAAAQSRSSRIAQARDLVLPAPVAEARAYAERGRRRAPGASEFRPQQELTGIRSECRVQPECESFRDGESEGWDCSVHGLAAVSTRTSVIVQGRCDGANGLALEITRKGGAARRTTHGGRTDSTVARRDLAACRASRVRDPQTWSGKTVEPRRAGGGAPPGGLIAPLLTPPAAAASRSRPCPRPPGSGR